MLDWILYPNFGFGFKAPGCRISVISDLFSKSIWKIKENIFMTSWTLGLILQFNLRLKGYSIWRVRTSRTIYKKGFGALSTSQPRSNQKYLEDYSKHSSEGSKALEGMFRTLEVLKDDSTSTRC